MGRGGNLNAWSPVGAAIWEKLRRCGHVEGSVSRGGLGELKDRRHSKCALCCLLATQDVSHELVLQLPCPLFAAMLPAVTPLPHWDCKPNTHLLLRVAWVGVFYHDNRKATNAGTHVVCVDSVILAIHDCESKLIDLVEQN